MAKVIFLGSAGVGKTSIIASMVNKTFQQCSPSISAEFHKIFIPIEGSEVELHLWDTAGSDTYRTVVPLYAKNSHVAVLVCSYSDKSSLDDLKGWYDLATNVADGAKIFFVVANKSDIFNHEDEENKPEIERNEVEQFSKSINATLFETSALTMAGIDELFANIADQVSSSNLTSEPACTIELNIHNEDDTKSTNKCC
ncbi:Ras-related protein Rab-2A [Tritrichomonas foetus]|uniref:Ras-related protein Rab-2A n=1 Tax=Tritrichomonas foetus TaxID=1144522 RepID=A0A1J4JUC5_9EUKA|nr:Ras-related protein Rab-2A [Tritrichomonas foetus]|eukprot:OHT02751.1 Ras-related protein Rab-2A [Tritrichomonas foetus]